jgi:hypothetical protein
MMFCSCGLWYYHHEHTDPPESAAGDSASQKLKTRSAATLSDMFAHACLLVKGLGGRCPSEDNESSPKEEVQVQVSPKLDFRTASNIQMPRSACRDVEGSVFVN